ncbi:MAG: serine/threonine protein kinase [Myxococcales bacterium]|nr:serine/threonine protein kinase [Myxococcales bacterium]
MARESVNLVCLACGRETTGALGALCPTDGVALVTSEEAATQREKRDPIIGRVVAGRFPVVALIGQGAYGTVYRAVQQPVGREVALKVMNLSAARDEELRTRFFREARVVARLSHPSAVTLFDYGEDHDGLLYMVLEYIRGRTLRDAIVEEAPLAPERVAALTMQVLGALVEAHGIGLIHRDLKPANIMLTREKTGEERAKVLDFGMAKVMLAEPAGGDEATRTGIVVGTPRYLSPEQALAREVGPQTDVYALGVMMYEMLAGRPPFVAPSTFELLMLHTSAEVPPLDPALGVPPPLEALVRHAMAKQVEHRFRDAEEMLDALIATEVPGTTRASMRPVARPRPPTTGEMEAMAGEAAPKLSDAALRAVAARTATLMPGTRIAASVGPPPVDHEALDQGTSATHGELSALTSGSVRVGRPGSALPWALAGLGLVAVAAAAMLVLLPGEEAADDRAAVATLTGVADAAPVAQAPDAAVVVDAARSDAAAAAAAELAADAAADAAPPEDAAADAAPDAAPAAPVADEAAPPGEAEVRELMAAARRFAFAPDGLARGETAAAAVDAWMSTVDDPAARGEVLLRRARLWRQIAQARLGDDRRVALTRARDDFLAAMNLTDPTKNFAHYKTAIELTEELSGDLSAEALEVACAPAHVAGYLHRGNHCALLEIRAGQTLAETDARAGAELVCRGAARFADDVPGQSPAAAKRREREKTSYLSMCNAHRREAAGR